MRNIYHIADFSSLGGVQTYLYGLKKNNLDRYKLLNISNKVLDIFCETSFINFFDLRFILRNHNEQILLCII